MTRSHPDRRHSRPLAGRAAPGVVALMVVAAVVVLILPAASRSNPGLPASPRAQDERAEFRAAAPAPESLDLLRRSLVDVAIMPPGRTGAGPQLLTVGPDPAGSDATLLAVLDRGAGRWNARTELRLEAPPDGATAPWLIALDDRRFALLTVEPRARRTTVQSVTWNGEDLRRGPRRPFDLRADDAGAADVDGDGRHELVLAEAPTESTTGACDGSALLVLDAATLDVRAEHRVAHLRLGAGVVGAIDPSPGDELVATAFTMCRSTGSYQATSVAAIRLLDGQVIERSEVVSADAGVAGSARPALADLQADGRPEVLVGTAEGLVILAPDRGWERTLVPELRGALLGVRAAVASRRHAGVAVVLEGNAIVAGVVRRGANTWRVEPAGRVDAAGVGGANWAGGMADLAAASLDRHPGPAWLDGAASCSPLVVTLAVLPCWPAQNPPSVAESALVPGAAWFATRPLARVAGPGSPILVARTERWPDDGRLGAPAPLAAQPAGVAWRHGPSQPFSMAEVPAPERGRRAIPMPVVDPVVPIDVPAATIRLADGARALVAVRPVDGATAVASTREFDALIGWSDRTVTRSLHLAASEALASTTLAPGSAPVDVQVPLAAPDAPPGSRPGWDVAAAAIGPLGDVSRVVTTRLAPDDRPPPLAIEVPFASVPWPLTTELLGATEPGARVRHAGRVVEVALDGTFRVPAVLAPWPQPIEVRALDPAGNVTVSRIDVVGGLDYRRLPWAPILLGALLVGAAVGGRLAGRGGVRRGSTTATGVEPWNEIEDGPVRPLDPLR